MNNKIPKGFFKVKDAYTGTRIVDKLVSGDVIVETFEEQKSEYPACDKCQSADISADSASKWNHKNQAWETVNVFDKGHYCNRCGEECRIKWIQGNPLEEE